jgi:hypothetical protein
MLQYNLSKNSTRSFLQQHKISQCFFTIPDQYYVFRQLSALRFFFECVDGIVEGAIDESTPPSNAVSEPEIVIHVGKLGGPSKPMSRCKRSSLPVLEGVENIKGQRSNSIQKRKGMSGDSRGEQSAIFYR